MIRIAVVILLLGVACLPARAQASKTAADVSEQQWQGMLEAVSNEQWDKAFELAAQSVDHMKVDDERWPRLRYIYLYAGAGRVSGDSMSFDELEQAVKSFIGKQIELPFRRIAMGCHGDFNFICAKESPTDSLMVAASNKAGTNIHAFEYVQLKEKFNAETHRDEYASIGGVIDSIKLNPNKSRFLVMRLYVSGGVVMLMDRKVK